jgi:hypothetical protein
MRVTPFAALLLFACGNTAPSSSSTNEPVGSAEAELRDLTQRDATDVDHCQALAKKCEQENGDSGANPVCQEVATHCEELKNQLDDVRADVQKCLTAAAACEKSAKSSAECQTARDACTSLRDDFEKQRGNTLQCADRAQQCLGHDMDAPRGFGRGRGDVADAGADVCGGNALDFVGCCHGQHRGVDRRGADAGAAPGFPPPFGAPGGRGGRGAAPLPGRGFVPPPMMPAPANGQAANAQAAGARGGNAQGGAGGAGSVPASSAPPKAGTSMRMKN